MLTGAMQSIDFFYATAVSCMYAAVCFAILVFNDLIFLRNRVRRARANIEVSLKKRFQVVTDLVEVVKGMVGHERGIQETVASLRTQMPDGKMDAEDASKIMEAEAAVSQKFYALAEAYPTLKSDEHFAKLMETMKDLENEIALMRDGYNTAVEHYNTRILTVPELFISIPLGMRKEKFIHEVE
jgi:hypothetical protein